MAVGSDLRLEYSALGDAINVAARMEQTATPGTVQVAEDTYRLVARYVEVEPLGEGVVKGKREPVATYRVVRHRPHREQAVVLPGQEPLLVDRREELGILAGVLEGFALGPGQVVFVVGDAGLGKSRLLREAIQRFTFCWWPGMLPCACTPSKRPCFTMTGPERSPERQEQRQSS